ncbi:MAG: undecaprenyldiphospho-muramoylpentapeptide beta-N-acetylglucosaminyltransferase [Acetobacteraceae bacterium]|nr:undecaprenyldiphospho-muramoylpentapeptide beta-N-acetylglucosaminyltransferase [Acetobacteraceae bacterium]
MHGGPIVIAAGGTGGHFFPAEALAAALLARSYQIALMTDNRSAGLQSPVFADYPRFVIPGAGIAGHSVLRAGKALVEIAAGIVQARSVLQQIRAAAIVGFGGYPSVAPILAAKSLRQFPSIILHEQNAVLGRANRFLARHADALALSFDPTERVPKAAPTIVTGNPIRPAIAALAELPYTPPDDEIQLLVLGGSLGARIFSDMVPAALASLPPHLRSVLSVTQQCRPEDIERVRSAYLETRISAELAPFFADIAERLAHSHLVIARAGASTVSELAVTGRPSILVPLPGAIDNHQTANARALAAVRGASVMLQRTMTADVLGGQIGALLDEPGVLAQAAKAARSISRPDAAERLADLVGDLIRQEVRS